jgi:hypothetical protein
MADGFESRHHHLGQPITLECSNLPRPYVRKRMAMVHVLVHREVMRIRKASPDGLTATTVADDGPPV